MKKLLASAAIAAVTMITTDASAQTRNFPYWYLGLSGGIAGQTDSDVSNSNNDISWDAGSIASASIGYQPPTLGGFRPEVEYSYRHQNFSGSGDIAVNVVAANLYYDFYNSSVLTPYIGGGIGYGHFNIDGASSGLDDSSSEAIYQGMVGVGYEPTSIHNVGFTLAYRYMAPFSDPSAGNAEYEYDNHSIEAGAKFRF